MYLSLFFSPLPSLNFFLFLCMSDVQPPLCPSSLCLLPFPLPCMSMFSLSCHSLTLSPSLSPPISLPQHGRSEFSWEGINVSVVTPFLHLLLFFLYLLVSFTCFDLTHPLVISSVPLTTPLLPLHLGFTVDLLEFIVVVHVSEHNQNHLLVPNKKGQTWNQGLGNADLIFCINPTSPSLLLSTHPSLTHTVSMSLCALSHLPYYLFLHAFPPSSIPLSSLPLAVYGRHHVNPASAQEELKRLRHRGSG